MALAAEYKIGQTTISIYDDCCKDQTPEQVQEILDNISRITTRCLREQMYQEELKKQKAI